MHLGNKIIHFALDKPKNVILITATLSLLFGLLLFRVQIETSPEYLLSEKDPTRIFHNQINKTFNLHDSIILTIVNTGEQGIFNPETLSKIISVSQFIEDLATKDSLATKIFPTANVTLTNAKTIKQNGLGKVHFIKILEHIPESEQQITALKNAIFTNPFLKDTLVSENGKAWAFTIPVTETDVAQSIKLMLQQKIASLPPGDDQFFIVGHPITLITFKHEMFKQLTVAALLTILVTSLILFIFFQNLTYTFTPILIAVSSCLTTIGIMVGIIGYPLHTMSATIPFFIMPIVIWESIHIITQFKLQYAPTSDRHQTIIKLMDKLFIPILFTSLTSASGFACLIFSTAPPVQQFGIFAASGIIIGWLQTMIILPAALVITKDNNLKPLNWAKDSRHFQIIRNITLPLNGIGKYFYTKPWIITGCITGLFLMGLLCSPLIQTDDTPLNWLGKGHTLTVTDKILNKHLAGTHTLNLILSGTSEEMNPENAGKWLAYKLNRELKGLEVLTPIFLKQINETIANSTNSVDLANRLSKTWEEELKTAALDDAIRFQALSLAIDTLGRLRNRDQVFLRPDVLQFVSKLQQHLYNLKPVGNTISPVDVVKIVHQELFEGDTSHYRIPATLNAVRQTLASYQVPENPNLLQHLITSDFSKIKLQLFIKDSSSKQLRSIINETNNFMAKNPSPINLTYSWTGQSYLNLVAQEKITMETLKASFICLIILFGLMVILFRSTLWGMLAIIPTIFTLTVFYGIVGITGTNFNIFTALLFPLTLGFGINFSIYFLQSSRTILNSATDWSQGFSQIHIEPAQTLIKNYLVMSACWTPLLFIQLTPFRTLGIFMTAMMLLTATTTLFGLPAVQIIMKKFLFINKDEEKK